MQCPKCGSRFESVIVESVEIDRCMGCGGLWFDASEKETLERSESARAIDTGDARAGREWNKTFHVDCPRCSVRMDRVVDRTQFHVEFESCPRCGGTYFDAGEFKDLASLSVMERMRKLVDIWLAVR